MKNLNSDAACNVVSAWTALEVLSPQSFRKPEDLASGNPRLIAPYGNDDDLPWENGGEEAPKNTKLFYQVIIGTIDLSKAVAALMEKYRDTNLERPSPIQKTMIAVVLVDQKGHLLKDFPSVAISSFAWGVPCALNKNLKELAAWSSIESALLAKFDIYLRRRDKEGNYIPLNKNIIEEAYKYLIETFNLTTEMVTNTYFAVRVYESLKKSEPPQPLILNSFYLKDLIKARDFISSNKASENLKRYLAIEVSSHRDDILHCYSTLEEAVSPKFIPPARWPGMGRHPLVLLQQAAVNLALNKLQAGGILAVNGPPGTGKTTLLRDVVAGLVTQRAEAMCAYEDPSLGFTSTGEKIQAGQGWLQLYTLDDKLKGCEILFASSNNKAVENISTELPNLKSIAKDAEELRYFSVLSDKLFGHKSWGLIAAVLGNSANRYRFVQTFWWDKDVGLSTYLMQVCGTPQFIEIKDPDSKKIIEVRAPQIIQQNDPPHNHQEALRRWHQARKNFQTILAQSNSKLAELENIRATFQYLDSLEEDDDEIEPKELENLLAEHETLKPGFIACFFQTAKARSWQHEKMILSNKRDKVINSHIYREKLGPHVFEKKLFMENWKDLHQVSPWCDQEMQLLRDNVFIAAIKLHKAFIDAAAKPLRHNLAIFMQHLSNPNVPNSHKINFLPDLWSSFFLVVPCVSTTFASIDRMLGKMPQESLGWLLIDEAGQSTPQSAVGAIMRTKRALVVGDPMQIEPIVSLPSELTQSICKQFEVDSDRFDAPNASVQTLSDDATPYFTEFEGKHGARSVGIPLLVHRRCNEPMFNIANTIAYERLMVQAKWPGISSIRDALGPSAWFNVNGQSEDKWCPEEGEKLIELLFKLKIKTVPPDLYIVTPFVIVANRIRKIIKASNILQSWRIEEEDENKWLFQRVGTVHTVQGREAEAVIFVLGAPAANQNGARIWAGAKPNLLNVAVTRAKEVIYVIGNKTLWSDAGVFGELAERIDSSPLVYKDAHHEIFPFAL